MSNRTRDTNSKRFQQEYRDEDFLEAVEQLDMPTATDIADELGCSKTTAANRLTELEKQEAVTAVEVGQAKVWQLA